MVKLYFEKPEQFSFLKNTEDWDTAEQVLVEHLEERFQPGSVNEMIIRRSDTGMLFRAGTSSIEERCDCVWHWVWGAWIEMIPSGALVPTA
ncbi:hypothetical protein ACTGNK_04650 [Bifidobacterium longum]